jgi:molecular chaperone IbpA
MDKGFNKIIVHFTIYHHHSCLILRRNAMVNDNMFANYILDRFFLKSLENTNQKFPLFNIGQSKEDSNKFILQLAVAGYSYNDIMVTLEKNILTIVGNEPAANEDSEYNFVVANIAKRKFVRRFTLFTDGISEVTKASVKDGILSIYIERIVPEEDRPKSIPVLNANNNGFEIKSNVIENQLN